MIARVAVASLDIRECTLSPGGQTLLDGSATGKRAAARIAMQLAAIDASSGTVGPAIELTRSITGALRIDPDAYTLQLEATIVDAVGGVALAGAGDPTTSLAAHTVIDGVTIFGTTRVQRISGRGGIFTGTLFVDDDQHRVSQAVLVLG